MKNFSFQRVVMAILVCLVVGLGIYVKLLEKAVERAVDSQYVLPSDLSQRFILKDRILKIYTRDKNGQTVVKKKYVPDEGGVEVRISTSPEKKEPVIIVKNKGLTIRPGFGALYETNHFLATVDAKLVYWSRASAGVGLTTRSLNLWTSYHLDWLPYWHPQNLEMTLGRSMLRFDTEPPRWHLGFRVNF